jgi:hypothetical protein
MRSVEGAHGWPEARLAASGAGRTMFSGALLFFLVLAATPGWAAPPEGGSTGSGPAYQTRLRELQNRVVALKEEIFRTKTRLTLIKERLLNNVIAESKLVLVHDNDLSGSYKVMEVVYYLDDNKIYFGDSSSAEARGTKAFNVYDGNVIPGHHVLAVEYVLKGDSAFFTYLEAFRFRVRSTFTFFAPRGRISVVRAKLYERGGALSDFRDRPHVKFDTEQLPYTRENLQKVSSGP